jgi:peptidoglycan/LPS O-acetylase OafA/YrhL
MDFTLLRLLLALAVVFTHFHAITGTLIGWVPDLSSTVAVQGFFVVSGWIVTASCESSAGHGGFFVRRLARLYPLYAVVVIAQALCVAALIGHPVNASGELLHYLSANLAFANFLKPTLLGFLDSAAVPAINPSLWTLKIEVLFYLTVPLLVALNRRFGMWSLLGLFAASTLYFCAVESTSAELAKQLPGQLRFFVAGMAGRLLLVGDRAPRRMNRLLLAGVGVAGWSLAQRFDSSIAMAAFQPVFVLAFVAAAGTLLPRIVDAPDISYGVYLLHAPLIQIALYTGWLPPGSPGLVAILVATLALATVACYVIERPAIRAGSRWSRRLAPNGYGAHRVLAGHSQ